LTVVLGLWVCDGERERGEQCGFIVN
jgi:hypothetical protein